MSKNKTEKAPTRGEKAAKAALTWGTMEWIRANPYSCTDRKRRARIRKALGAEFDEITKGPHVCCAVARLDEVVKRYGIVYPKKFANRVATALAASMDYDVAVCDEAIGRALAKKWGLG